MTSVLPIRGARPDFELGAGDMEKRGHTCSPISGVAMAAALLSGAGSSPGGGGGMFQCVLPGISPGPVLQDALGSTPGGVARPESPVLPECQWAPQRPLNRLSS